MCSRKWVKLENENKLKRKELKRKLEEDRLTEEELKRKEKASVWGVAIKYGCLKLK